MPRSLKLEAATKKLKLKIEELKSNRTQSNLSEMTNTEESARIFLHKYFDFEMTEDSDVDIAEALYDEISNGEIEEILKIVIEYAKTRELKG